MMLRVLSAVRGHLLQGPYLKDEEEILFNLITRPFDGDKAD